MADPCAALHVICDDDDSLLIWFRIKRGDAAAALTTSSHPGEVYNRIRKAAVGWCMYIGIGDVSRARKRQMYTRVVVSGRGIFFCCFLL